MKVNPAFWILSVLLIGGMAWPASAQSVLAEERAGLTFEERVMYQRAIEEVNWRHRTWPAANPQPKPALAEVMPKAALQAKVKDYLRKSQALTEYWQRPLRREQLQAELERMARQTQQPERLRELWAVLGNDPYVIAECLARPALADRLVRSWYAGEEWYYRTGKEGFAAWWAEVRSRLSGAINGPRAAFRLPMIPSGSGGCVADTWTALGTPRPGTRYGHTAVWTGTEMIVWGGFGYRGYLNTGGRYDPATDIWAAISTVNAPNARYGHAAVWTGTEMLVWGGGTDTGGRYCASAGIEGPPPQ